MQQASRCCNTKIQKGPQVLQWHTLSLKLLSFLHLYILLSLQEKKAPVRTPMFAADIGSSDLSAAEGSGKGLRHRAQSPTSVSQIPYSQAPTQYWQTLGG